MATDLIWRSALEQAALMRQKAVSPLELTQHYLHQIHQWNDTLGSYFTVMAEAALADAQQKTEYLHRAEPESLPLLFGVPISLKDLFAVAGAPCTLGNAALKQRLCGEDDGVTQRVRQAGCVILGKTATSEFASFPFVEPDGFLPARNPWHLDYTTGGSSGGAASSVAAGLAAIALGSDGGGSIRGPAACCGLVGIKPSRGRVSNAPLGDLLSGIASNGPIARTVADAAALLDVISGYTTGDPYWLPDPAIPFHQIAQNALTEKTPPLRIRFSTTISPIGAADPLCGQAVLTVIQHLETLGHIIEPGCPDFTALVEPFTAVWQAGPTIPQLPAEWMGRLNRGLVARCGSCGDYLRAVAMMQQVARQIVHFFDAVDILVLPTLMAPPWPIGIWRQWTIDEAIQEIIRWVAPCPPFNATGQPALSLPVTLTPQGLPIGVQLVGRPAAEATLLALAAQLEAMLHFESHYVKLVESMARSSS